MLTLRQFAPKEVIIRENESGETAFIIERGKVEITKEQDGKQVHIAFMEGGKTFGEMSMVDDMPRSATVTAVEQTLVREIHRDELYSTMKENPEDIIKLLKNIFERLREANVLIAQIKTENAHGGRLTGLMAALAKPSELAAAKPVEPAVIGSIEGLTPQAIEAISHNPFEFKSFPFKIGRKSHDPIVSNHLEISDQAPLQISRHHVSIIREGGKIGVVDRGSHLGASVDNVRIGGKQNPGPVFFQGSEGILVLGPESSPYRYKIRILS